MKWDTFDREEIVRNLVRWFGRNKTNIRYERTVDTYIYICYNGYNIVTKTFDDRRSRWFFAFYRTSLSCINVGRSLGLKLLQFSKCNHSLVSCIMTKCVSTTVQWFFTRTLSLTVNCHRLLLAYHRDFRQFYTNCTPIQNAYTVYHLKAKLHFFFFFLNNGKKRHRQLNTLHWISVFITENCK